MIVYCMLVYACVSINKAFFSNVIVSTNFMLGSTVEFEKRENNDVFEHLINVLTPTQRCVGKTPNLNILKHQKYVM